MPMLSDGNAMHDTDTDKPTVGDSLSVIPEQGASPSPAFLTIQCTLVLGPLVDLYHLHSLRLFCDLCALASLLRFAPLATLARSQPVSHTAHSLTALLCGCLPLSSCGPLPPRARLVSLSLRCSLACHVMSLQSSIAPTRYGYILACYLRILSYTPGFLN